MKRSAVMFIAIGGPKAHVTLGNAVGKEAPEFK